MVAAIVFALFDIIYTVDVIGYTPTLRFSDDNTMPLVRDPNLRVEEVVQGLELPTTMAFLDADNILVLEKNKGTVQRIVDGQIKLKDACVGSPFPRIMRIPNTSFFILVKQYPRMGGRLLAIVCIGTKY